MTKFFNITVSATETQMQNDDFPEDKGLREYTCRKLNKKVQKAEREFVNPIKLIKFDEAIKTVYEEHGTKMQKSLISGKIESVPNIVSVEKCTISAYFKVDLNEKIREED